MTNVSDNILLVTDIRVVSVHSGSMHVLFYDYFVNKYP